MLLAPENPPKQSEFRNAGEREGSYFVASLSLSDENERIGANNGQAEVDEDHGALGADVPETNRSMGWGCREEGNHIGITLGFTRHFTYFHTDT